jgi:hypothetical protein
MNLLRPLRLWSLRAGLVLALGVAVLVLVQDQTPPSPVGRYGAGSARVALDAAPPVPATALAAGEAGLYAVLDPETGELAGGLRAQRLLSEKSGPDLAADPDLRNMLSRSTEGLVAVAHPDGRVGVHLQGRFMNASVARLGDDGTLQTACVESEQGAAAFWQGSAAADDSGPEVR